MIMQRMQSMVGGVRAALASGTQLPTSWAPYASLASGCALAVLGHDDAGDACRSDVERLLRDAKLYDIGAGTNEIRRFLIGRELMGS
jgi:hypothetical protein